MQDSALQKMPLASGVRGIDYLNNLNAFQDLVSKSQVKKLPMFAANTSSTFNSFALITISAFLAISVFLAMFAFLCELNHRF